MEFDTDDDVAEQLKNANDVKAEGKVRVRNVGSPQVPFLMYTLEIPQKLQHKFFALNFCYLYF